MPKYNAQWVRRKIMQEITKQFIKSKQGSDIILHCDWKLLKKHTKKRKSGAHSSKCNLWNRIFLLGIPSCTDVTGLEDSETIIEFLDKKRYQSINVWYHCFQHKYEKKLNLILSKICKAWPSEKKIIQEKQV